MDWQERLIGLYLYICEHYKTHLWVHAQRLSNNSHPKFSDEEVLTLYLFGMMQNHTTIKAILPIQKTIYPTGFQTYQLIRAICNG